MWQSVSFTHEDLPPEFPPVPAPPDPDPPVEAPPVEAPPVEAPPVAAPPLALPPELVPPEGVTPPRPPKAPPLPPLPPEAPPTPKSKWALQAMVSPPNSATAQMKTTIPCHRMEPKLPVSRGSTRRRSLWRTVGPTVLGTRVVFKSGMDESKISSRGIRIPRADPNRPQGAQRVALRSCCGRCLPARRSFQRSPRHPTPPAH